MKKWAGTHGKRASPSGSSVSEQETEMPCASSSGKAGPGILSMHSSHKVVRLVDLRNQRGTQYFLFHLQFPIGIDVGCCTVTQGSGGDGFLPGLLHLIYLCVQLPLAIL